MGYSERVVPYGEGELRTLVRRELPFAEQQLGRVLMGMGRRGNGTRVAAVLQREGIGTFAELDRRIGEYVARGGRVECFSVHGIADFSRKQLWQWVEGRSDAVPEGVREWLRGVG